MSGSEELLRVLYSLSSSKDAAQNRIQVVEPEPEPEQVPDERIGAIVDGLASLRLTVIRGLIFLTLLLGVGVVLEVLHLIR